MKHHLPSINGLSFLKAFSFLSTLFCMMLVSPVFAQKKLTSSRTSGYYTYIYKLTDKESFEIASDTRSVINDSFMHTLVDSFYTDKKKFYKSRLPYGNYLYVNAAANELVYNLVPVNNVNLQFINNGKDLQFILTDLKGKGISDAAVTLGRRSKVRYDQQANLYRSRSTAKPGVIGVKYNGVSNYFTYDMQKYRPYKKSSFFKRLFNPKRYGPVFNGDKDQPKYTGYMVFNKPMYRPLDTVKFKAYLLTAKGKALHNKPLRVELQKERNVPGLVLATLNSYHEGGYEYSFVLADSLQLTLDRDYDIVLEEQKGQEWTAVYRRNFRYEDYELKSVNFAVRTDRDVHSPGSPVTVFFKATDENELAVPDGRVEMTVTTGSVSNFYDAKVFVKDTLWKKNIVLDPVGETKLVLPDSIFPKADLNFSMNFTFLNSNNECRTAYKSLSYRLRSQDIKADFKGDSLRIDYLVNGQSLKQKALIFITYKDSEQKDSVLVELPGVIKMDYRATHYLVKTANGYQQAIRLADLNPGIQLSAAQNKDSLQVVVNNAHKLFFWYTVFSGNDVISKGYTDHLDTLIKHSGTKAAHVGINYIWTGAEMNTETSAFYAPQFLNVKLLAPDLVYPGQTVNMQVKVTDVNDQPVAAIDVTAYAYTSRFKNGQDVTLPDFGKRFFAREKKPQIDGEKLDANGSMALNWAKWGRELGLDTIQYYQFTQTKDRYVIQENSKNDSTVVAPFVVKDGKIEPVHVVYIDDIPVFFSQAEQLQRYAFNIQPGKHSLGLRTAGHMVYLDDFDFKAGKKTIISIAADVLNKKARVSKASNALTEEEAELLTKYMFKVQDNFNEEKSQITTDEAAYLLNPPPLVSRNKELLVGPFSENYLRFKSGGIDETFIKEPGYVYTFLPGLLKQKSYGYKYGFNTFLGTVANENTVDYTQDPLKRDEIDQIWNEYLDLRSFTTSLFNNRNAYNKTNGKLMMKLDTTVSKRMPFVKNIIIYKDNEPDFLQIYPGNTIYFSSLESGRYRIMYLFKDNRYFVAEHVDIKKNGINYFEWKGMKIMPEDRLSRRIDTQVKSVKMNGNSIDSDEAGVKILEKLNEVYFDSSTLIYNMSGRVTDTAGSVLPGVAVKIKGLNYGVVTDKNGRFEIKVPKKGKLILAYIDYFTKEVKIINGNAGDLKLEQHKNSLDEVTVVGYGAQSKRYRSGSVQAIIGDLQGRVDGLQLNEIVIGKSFTTANIMIRGASALPNGQKPMVIVDGLPYNGDINSLDPNSIASMNILKEAEATAIYGSGAANGVIIIKTKAGNMQPNPEGELAPQQETMRTHFSDYAIWQPKLLTDAEGRASFSVKFPDDITSWTTKLIAMNGKKQGGTLTTNIKSFKTLSANFVSPQFAIAGDSIKVIGKLMNYNNTAEVVNRKFSYNGTPLLNSTLEFKNSHIDTVAILAKGMAGTGTVDSLSFEYTMKQDNGYFDGEIRKIPLLQAGVSETIGYFNALTGDTTLTYKFDPDLGPVTLRAEASVFPALLDEMEKLRRYEYLCNEQLASKLKALLLEKTVRKYLGEDFKEEKNIKELLKKLQNTKRTEGTWGWWQDSNEELWISLHVVEALMQAQKQGYAVALDKDKLYAYLVGKLADRKDIDQIYAVKLLHLLNEKYYIKDWIGAIEKQQAAQEKKDASYKQPLYEKLQIMQLRQQAGLPVDVKKLLTLKKETMFGNIYWGEESNRFWDNSIQNTLLAYQILKTDGNHKTEQDQMLRYFLEQRKDGQWRNTYESSLILETILPDLMRAGQKPEPSSLVLNKTEKVTTFPFRKVVEPAALTVEKKGDAPVYFTAYQQFNNPKPEKVSKDFTVKTSFNQNGMEAQKLKAGTVAILKVEVEVRADADYVMIEVPIPAGCSYENKSQNYLGLEAHREYFKHKTSIFCTKLKQGKYNFTIQLMPRYSGNYILNPAKAEMMYFPVFYGREGMKRMVIK